jgi:toxin CptA
MTSAPAIGFEYRASRWIPGLFLFVTALTLLAVFLSGASVILQASLAVAAILACIHAWHRLRLPVYAVGWSKSGWTLRGLDGGDDPAVLRSHRVMGSFILLRLSSQRYGKLTLWLMPDNSDADVRRRLRMRLALPAATLEK